MKFFLTKNSLVLKIFGVVCIFMFYRFILSLNYFYDSSNFTLEAQISSLTQRKKILEDSILLLKSENNQMKLKLEKIYSQ